MQWLHIFVSFIEETKLLVDVLTVDVLSPRDFHLMGGLTDHVLHRYSKSIKLSNL